MNVGPSKAATDLEIFLQLESRPDMEPPDGAVEHGSMNIPTIDYGLAHITRESMGMSHMNPIKCSTEEDNRISQGVLCQKNWNEQ